MLHIIQRLLKILYSLAVRSSHASVLTSFSALTRVQFLIDKNGQLGIWDARAPPDEVADEDGDVSTPSDEQERGKYWRLQAHWPANPKSSISAVKFDPTDSHSVSMHLSCSSSN